MASRNEHQSTANDNDAAPTSPYTTLHNPSSTHVLGEPPKKGLSKWVKFGIPVALFIIVGIILAAVLGPESKKSDSSSSANTNFTVGRIATATDSDYFMPVYPSTVCKFRLYCYSLTIYSRQTNTAIYGEPTFGASKSKLSWPKDTFQPSDPSPTTVRTDRPRLIAPAYKWSALPQLIFNDPYLSGWNSTIFHNATEYYDLPPVVYHMDGVSGILDNAREIKMRVKAFAYAYRLSNDTKWLNRTWIELEVSFVISLLQIFSEFHRRTLQATELSVSVRTKTGGIQDILLTPPSSPPPSPLPTTGSIALGPTSSGARSEAP